VSAEIEFENWWHEAFPDEQWARTGVHDLVKTAWLAGYAKHLSLIHEAAQRIQRSEE